MVKDRRTPFYSREGEGVFREVSSVYNPGLERGACLRVYLSVHASG